MRREAAMAVLLVALLLAALTGSWLAWAATLASAAALAWVAADRVMRQVLDRPIDLHRAPADEP